MEVWWTAAPDIPVVAIGLWRTKAEAQAYIAKERLGQPHEHFAPVPVVIDDAGVAEDDEDE